MQRHSHWFFWICYSIGLFIRSTARNAEFGLYFVSSEPILKAFLLRHTPLLVVYYVGRGEPIVSGHGHAISYKNEVEHGNFNP
jgi:hypothetical protein